MTGKEILNKHRYQERTCDKHTQVAASPCSVSSDTSIQVRSCPRRRRRPTALRVEPPEGLQAAPGTRHKPACPRHASSGDTDEFPAVAPTTALEHFPVPNICCLSSRVLLGACVPLTVLVLSQLQSCHAALPADPEGFPMLRGCRGWG